LSYRAQYTSDQRRALDTFRRQKRTAVKSGHGVGKTLFAAAAALTVTGLYQCQLIATSSSQFQVRTRLWAEFKRLYRRARIPIGGELTETMLWFDDKWFATAVATDDPNNIQGGHGENVVVVADEAQGVKTPIWDAIESMMGSSSAKSLFLFNPLYSTGPSFDLSRQPDKWRLLTFSCLNHPNVLTGTEVIPGAVTREWVEDRRRAWGEASPLYQARVLGNYPTRTATQIFSLDDLEACTEILIPESARDGGYIGCDPARFGDDDTDITVSIDREVVHHESHNGWSTSQTAGRLVQLMDEYDIPPERVAIDTTGVGAGVADILRDQGRKVNEVVVGGAPHYDWKPITGTMKFVNRRAELHFVGRELLRLRLAKIPARYEDMWADLLAPNQKPPRSDGGLVVEAKDELRKRLGRSPNAGDSWLYTLHRSSRPRITVFS
jgi:hypothetical protein